MKRIIAAIEQGLSEENNDARRFFHGRGQCYEGLGFINVDWFAPVLLITLYQEPDAVDWHAFTDNLTVFQSDMDAVLVQRRYIRGAPLETLWGDIPQQAQALEQGLRYSLSFGGKQNVGFFLDMLPGREWLKQRATGKKVLNLFSYTCAFSVVAIAENAHSVVNLDMSSAALNVGRSNHRLNQHDDRLKRDIQFLSHDLFRSWKKVISKGPYDIVIIDPPSRQKGSFIATSDYIKVVRRLLSLMPKGGDILACLNAPELDEQFLLDLFTEACPEASFVERLEARKDFPEADSRRNLKMLHYQL
ncbi:class I SAM-dependent methyltransferase [Oceanicoccus sagamiensis]|uniref:S-adenosylmethionine-dependent methyltransferase domain-containing protein n=1 Tax=Oceanicoccus sagamiensis TaxID=716816 RepID=A0A1X9NFS5_9GAMM|nr:class I SAM-dependent methyltransferase [Oceanicoccus sagamiensis]ARN75894.1 hypothetical protein BST96_18385 [Oceanicoccus sagamiensis]